MLGEHGKLTCLNAELNGRLAEEKQNRMIEVELVNTKTVEDNRIQELQGQIDVMISGKVVFEENLQAQVMLQREIENLRRYKIHILGLLKEDEEHKAQNLDLRSQVDAMKQERAELQRQFQAIEVGLRAELVQASNTAKLVPASRDSQAGKVKKLAAELTLAYSQ